MARLVSTVALFAWAALPVFAQNPDDLSFHLRLTKEQAQYAVDEPIAFEVSLSSTAEHKYYANWTALVPFSGIKLSLEPQASAVDLGALRLGFIGSILGSSGYLTPTPIRETGDLTQWYRFQTAGHFRFSLSLGWVSRVKSKDEGGGKEPIPLQSNEVGFDIVPPDAGSAAQDLVSILNDIDSGKNEQDRQNALHRLDLLQTPAATEEKVRRYLESAHLGYGPYYGMLLNSSQLDQIIPSLEAALANPSIDPPPGIVRCLGRFAGA